MSGRFRNTPETFWRRVDKSGGPDACWPWTGAKTAHGYGTVHYEGRDVRTHRLAFFLAVGPTDILVLHRCDNPPCCNPGHLFSGTYHDNTADMCAKGRNRAARGEKSGQAKLTEAQVIEIRASTEPQRALARRYGVARSHICRIRRRQKWDYLSDPSEKLGERSE